MRMRRRWRRSASAQSMSSASRRALPCRRSSAAAANAPSEPVGLFRACLPGLALTQRRARRRKACSLGDAAAMRARRRAARASRGRARAAARGAERAPAPCVPRCTRVSLNTSQSRAAPRSGIRRAAARQAASPPFSARDRGRRATRSAAAAGRPASGADIRGRGHTPRRARSLPPGSAPRRRSHECLVRGGDFAQLRTAPLARRRKSLPATRR